MSNARVAASSALVCAVSLASLLSASLSPIRMDSQPVSFETAVSAMSNPDPRDETSIAVSPKNDQNMVGVSKVDIGGGPGPRGQGNVQVAYYFTSDGGHSWSSGLTSFVTPQAIWQRSSDPSVAAALDGDFYIGLPIFDHT